MTDGVEGADAAARRFAGELERLRLGLLELGVRPEGWPVPVPVGEWPVTAALDLLAGRVPRPRPVMRVAGAGRWVEVGPGRSVYRPAGSEPELIGPDALLPFFEPRSVEALRRLVRDDVLGLERSGVEGGD